MGERAERGLLAAVGAVQGVAVWLVVEPWPAGQPAQAVAFGLVSGLLASAAVLHFAWTGRSHGRLLALALAVGLVYGAVGAWLGSTQPAGDAPASGDGGIRVASWIPTSVATLFALGPFLQVFQRTGRPRFPYEALFRHALANLSWGASGLAITGVLWALLALQAGLFGLIGIDAFRDVFFAPPFVAAVTGAAAALGVAVGRGERHRRLATAEGSRAVSRGLLALVGGVALLFLGALPLTGLRPLWDTGHASVLLLGWVAAGALLLNAAWRDGRDARPRSTVQQRAIEAGLVALSGFVVIAAHALSLRIDQHGLTPQRAWGVLVWIALATCALGYGAAALRGGEPWLRWVRPVNRTAAAGVVALGLLAHTPVLDPVAWSARSQYGRLVAGRVPAAEFDYGYLRFRLGAAGRERFERLAALEAHPELADLRAGVARARAAGSYWAWQEDARGVRVAEAFQVLPPGTEAPAALLEALDRFDWLRSVARLEAGACADGRTCALFPADLGPALPDAWVALVADPASGSLLVFGRGADGSYALRGLLEPLRAPSAPEDLVAALRAGRYRAVPPELPDLALGGSVYRFAPLEGSGSGALE